MEDSKRSRESSQMPSMALRISNLVVLCLLLAVKVAVKAGIFGKEYPAKALDTPLTPAGWAFTTWVMIFSLQAAGTVYQLMPHGYTQDGSKQRIINTIGYGWQGGWYAEAALQLASLIHSAAGAWVCLATLLSAFFGFAWTLARLYRNKEQHGPLSNVWLYVMYFLPTSVNAAWLSTLTGISVVALPAFYGLQAHLDTLAVVVVVAMTCIGAYVVHRYKDSAYGLTLIWAFVAIYGRQQATPIRVVALSCTAVTFMFSLASVLRRGSGGFMSCTAVTFMFSLASVLRRRQNHNTELADMRQPLNRGERLSEAV